MKYLPLKRERTKVKEEGERLSTIFVADCELSLGPFPPSSLLLKTSKPLGFVTKYSSLSEKGDSVRIEMSAPDDVNRDFIP